MKSISCPEYNSYVKNLELQGVPNKINSKIGDTQFFHQEFEQEVVNILCKTYVVPLSNEDKLTIVFDTRKNEVNAYFATHNGSIKEIKQENLPSEIKNIQNVETFEKYINQVNIRTAILSNGDINYIYLKLNLDD